ncbi:MAG: hypothetical protein RLZZ546_986, partial [Bacteroidota bacterium]
MKSGVKYLFFHIFIIIFSLVEGSTQSFTDSNLPIVIIETQAFQ